MDLTLRKYDNTGLCKNFKVKKTKEAFDPFQSSGLDDEDALSTHPEFPHTQRPAPTSRTCYKPEEKKLELKCDYSQRNNVGTHRYSHDHTSLIYYQIVHAEPDSENPSAEFAHTRSRTKV